MSRFFNWKVFMTIFVLFILILALFNATRNRVAFSQAEKIVIDCTAPLQNGWHAITWRLDSVWQQVNSFRQLKAEREFLADNVRELRKQTREYEELKLENARLRELLEFKEKFAYKTVGADVIARDVNNWDNYLVINKGLNDGIDKGMAVVTPNGLIGQTTMVTNSTARVLLILDENSTVSAMIQETRDNGMAEGQGKGSFVLNMKRLPRDTKVKKGDHVFSSGLGGIFPKGLFIGRVEKVINDHYDIAKSAVVIPAENFNRLEEVLVIVNNTPIKPLLEVEGRKEEEKQ